MITAEKNRIENLAEKYRAGDITLQEMAEYDNLLFKEAKERKPEVKEVNKNEE